MSTLPSWAAPFFASVPALLLGVAVIAAGTSQLPTPATPPVLMVQNAPTEDLLRVPISRTLLVKSEPSNGSIVLRGRVQPQATLLGLAGDADGGDDASSGRAGVNGTIERVWVKPGDFVQAGQLMVQISTGAAVRPAPSTEKAQTKAEAAQVAAAQQQEALNQRLVDAQTRLSDAQTRVQQAQLKVAQAREVVRRLQTGDTSDAALATPVIPDKTAHQNTPAPTAQAAPATPMPRNPVASAGNDAQRDAAQAERDTLLREARRLSEDADAAEQRAKDSQADATKADDEARTSKAKIADLQAKVQATQKAFDAGGAKGSDVEGARAAVEDAQNDAAASATRAVVSRQEAEQFRSKAQLLRSRAQDAQNRATASLRKLQLFSDETQKPVAASGTTVGTNTSPAAKRRRRKNRKNRVTPALPAPLPAPAAPSLPPSSTNGKTGVSTHMTVQQAAKLVRSAVAESEAALADSHRIEREVADYKKRVSSTTQNIATSSETLRKAQDRVLATGVRTMITPVHAKVAGIVQSVANIAKNVGPDDIVFTVEPLMARGVAPRHGAQSGLLEARLPDPSGVWRTLKPGRTLSALLVAPSAVAPMNSGANGTQPFKPSAQLVLPAHAVSPHTPVPHTKPSHGSLHPAHSSVTHGQGLTRAQLPPHRVQPNQHVALPATGVRHNVQLQPTLPSQGRSPLVLAQAPTTKATPGISVMLRVRDVAPPVRPGAPAIVRAAVNYQAPIGSDTSKMLGAGAGVLCSIPKPGGRSAMRVPISAIWHDASGIAKIAVLRSLSGSTLGATLKASPMFARPAPSVPTPSRGPLAAPAAPSPVAPSNPLAASPAKPAAVKGLFAPRESSEMPTATPLTTTPSISDTADALPATDNVVLVEWHTVVTGSSDGVLQEIVSGLQQGERIVLDPQLLLVRTAPVGSPSLNDEHNPSVESEGPSSPSNGDEPNLTSETPATAPTPERQEMQPGKAERVLLVRQS